MEICLQISNTPLFGNELELIKIKRINHKMDKLRLDFNFFFKCLNYIFKIHKCNTTILPSIVIELRS